MSLFKTPGLPLYSGGAFGIYTNLTLSTNLTLPQKFFFSSSRDSTPRSYLKNPSRWTQRTLHSYGRLKKSQTEKFGRVVLVLDY